MESITEKIENFVSVNNLRTCIDNSSFYSSIIRDCSEYDVGSGAGSSYSNGAGTEICSGNGYGSSAGAGAGVTYGFGYDRQNGNIKALDNVKVYYINNIPTIIESVKGNYAKGFIINNDITLTTCFIAKVETSFGHGITLKEAYLEAQAKAIEKLPIEERIEMFKSEFPTLSSNITGKQFCKPPTKYVLTD